MSRRPGTSAQRRRTSSGSATDRAGVRLDPHLDAERRGLGDAPAELLDAHRPRGRRVLGPAHAGENREAGDAELGGDARPRPRTRAGRARAAPGRAGSARSPRPSRRSRGTGPRSRGRGPRATRAAASRSLRDPRRGSSPPARNSARSTSSNPRSFTIPIRSCWPGTAGNEYSLQETRATQAPTRAPVAAEPTRRAYFASTPVG